MVELIFCKNISEANIGKRTEVTGHHKGGGLGKSQKTVLL